MTTEIVNARFEEAIKVFEDLRREDNMELSRLGNPTEVLTELLESSQAFVGRVDGEPACVFGIRPPEGMLDAAVLWLLTSKLVDKAPFALARGSVRFVSDALREWGVLEGWVLEDNDRSKTWLRWLGFSLSETFELPPVGTVRKFSARL